MKNLIEKSINDIRQEGFIFFILKTKRFLYNKLLLDRYADKIVKIKKKKRYFLFRNSQFEYFIHPYNPTWRNERSIEIPIITNYIKTIPSKKTLEIGAVLIHYTKKDWDVVDKFELGEGIINKDITDYKPEYKYDLIISISTIEHIGLDDEDNPNKIFTALDKIKALLNPDGKIVITVPIGYNKFMDNLIFEGKFGFDEGYFMKRISRKNDWIEVPMKDVIKTRYNYPYNHTNAIAILLFNGDK